MDSARLVTETQEEFRARMLVLMSGATPEEFDRYAEVLPCDPASCDQDDCTGWVWFFRFDAPVNAVARAIAVWTRTGPL